MGNGKVGILATVVDIKQLRVCPLCCGNLTGKMAGCPRCGGCGLVDVTGRDAPGDGGANHRGGME